MHRVVILRQIHTGHWVTLNVWPPSSLDFWKRLCMDTLACDGGGGGGGFFLACKDLGRMFDN